MATAPGTSGPSDRELLRRYVAGEVQSGAVLYARHRAGLMRYLLRRLRRRDLAEESVQETYARLFSKAPDLVEHPRPVAWLYRVARNVAVDLHWRRRTESFTDAAVDASQLVDSRVSENPLEHLERDELNRDLLAAVRGLPPLERQVFLLRTVGGHSFRAIAEKLGAPLNTVLSRMHRGLKRLRAAVDSPERPRSAERDTPVAGPRDVRTAALESDAVRSTDRSRRGKGQR